MAMLHAHQQPVDLSAALIQLLMCVDVHLVGVSFHLGFGNIAYFIKRSCLNIIKIDINQELFGIDIVRM